MPSPASTTVPISSREAALGSYDLTKFAKASLIASGLIAISAMVLPLSLSLPETLLLLALLVLLLVLLVSLLYFLSEISTAPLGQPTIGSLPSID
jgi:hypothetical protein